MPSMEFQIVRSNNPAQPFFWRIVTSNGQILAASETYVNKQDAINAAYSVQLNAGTAQVRDYAA